MRQRLGVALIAVLATGGSVFAQLDQDDAANKPAEIEPLADTSLLLDLAVAGNRLVAVGERGHVMLSDDQGATWRQAIRSPWRQFRLLPASPRQTNFTFLSGGFRDFSRIFSCGARTRPIFPNSIPKARTCLNASTARPCAGSICGCRGAMAAS